MMLAKFNFHSLTCQIAYDLKRKKKICTYANLFKCNFIYRKLYVFKIIPFLNPDGVANGLYRSDTLGHNLNRVYLNPRLDRHPSIYAVRKLIRYYHYGCDRPDGDELDKSTVINCGAEDGCAMDEKESIEFASLINELKEEEENEGDFGDEEDALMMMSDKGEK
jgi:hypothetical protein